MMAKPGEGKQRHVGDGVLIAGRDKRQQTPPDSNKFCRAFGTDCHPDRQTHQPVTQCAFEKERHRGLAGFCQRDGVDEAGIDRQQAAAAPAIQQRHENGTRKVTHPGLRQNRPHLPLADGPRLHAQGQEHGVAGEQFRAGDNHQR